MSVLSSNYPKCIPQIPEAIALEGFGFCYNRRFDSWQKCITFSPKEFPYEQKMVNIYWWKKDRTWRFFYYVIDAEDRSVVYDSPGFKNIEDALRCLKEQGFILD